MSVSLIFSQMMRVISSPSNSTTGLMTWIRFSDASAADRVTGAGQIDGTQTEGSAAGYGRVQTGQRSGMDAESADGRRGRWSGYRAIVTQIRLQRVTGVAGPVESCRKQERLFHCEGLIGW